jgi:hypothetical protein
LILSKGDTPLKLEVLWEKLNNLWKPLSQWAIVSLGRGFYEFVFSSAEDVQQVRAMHSWSLKPGFLKLFAWTPDFNANNHKQTTMQCWVRLLELPQEYWSHNILFAIASCLETPIILDAATSKCPLERSFGHFARVLIDIDLSTKLRHKLWVEREGYAFLVNVHYENLPLFCSHCSNIGHTFSSCKLVKVVQEKLDTHEKHKRLGNKTIHVQKNDLGKESVECVANATEACVDNNPLLGFVDSTKLKATVDGEVVSIDTLHPDNIGANGNENLSVSSEERCKKAIHDVFGSNSSVSTNNEHQREHYPDMRLIGSWSDEVTNLSNPVTKSNEIVTDDNLNPRVAHNLEILRQYVWKGNEATYTGPQVYTDEEERAAAINYLRNRAATTEEPFTEVVSKAGKKNLKKGF